MLGSRKSKEMDLYSGYTELFIKFATITNFHFTELVFGLKCSRRFSFKESAAIDLVCAEGRISPFD